MDSPPVFLRGRTYQPCVTSSTALRVVSPYSSSLSVRGPHSTLNGKRNERINVLSSMLVSLPSISHLRFVNELNSLCTCTSQNPVSVTPYGLRGECTARLETYLTQLSLYHNFTKDRELTAFVCVCFFPGTLYIEKQPENKNQCF